MRIVKTILGVCAGLFACAYLVQFINVLMTSDHSTRGTTQIVAAFSVLCGAAAISVWLLQSAFKRR
jgi:CDP-diglyceride synthetase